MHVHCVDATRALKAKRPDATLGHNYIAVLTATMFC